ncbi:MAG: hypothetical protein ACK559_24415, partial [bacterium]
RGEVGHREEDVARGVGGIAPELAVHAAGPLHLQGLWRVLIIAGHAHELHQRALFEQGAVERVDDAHVRRRAELAEALAGAAERAERQQEQERVGCAAHRPSGRAG